MPIRKRGSYKKIRPTKNRRSKVTTPIQREQLLQQQDYSMGIPRKTWQATSQRLEPLLIIKLEQLFQDCQKLKLLFHWHWIIPKNNQSGASDKNLLLTLEAGASQITILVRLSQRWIGKCMEPLGISGEISLTQKAQLGELMIMYRKRIS